MRGEVRVEVRYRCRAELRTRTCPGSLPETTPERIYPAMYGRNALLGPVVARCARCGQVPLVAIARSAAAQPAQLARCPILNALPTNESRHDDPRLGTKRGFNVIQGRAQCSGPSDDSAGDSGSTFIEDRRPDDAHFDVRCHGNHAGEDQARRGTGRFTAHDRPQDGTR